MDASILRVARLNNKCAYTAGALMTAIRRRPYTGPVHLPRGVYPLPKLKSSIITTASAAVYSSSSLPNSRSSVFPSGLSFPFPSTSPFFSAASLFTRSNASVNPARVNAVWDGFGWGVLEGGIPTGLVKGATVWTAVLLGWLGAEHRQLRRYAELYRAAGVRVVSFVIPPSQLLGIDLGRNVERRIAGFTDELVSRVSEAEKDGTNCGLLFHTFSNTGWFTYGAILDNLQSRPDMINKIKGCIVDSGADADINPQVWAAGFCAAFLKKRSSLTQPAQAACQESSDGSGSRSSFQDGQPPLTETFMFAVFEKLFSFILGLPDVNRRLSKIISTLRENQPLCPQLYLYSTADKVIPFQSVERFIQDQRASGRMAHACDFVSSPHVDHLRSFPDLYSAEVSKFLEECLLDAVGQT